MNLRFSLWDLDINTNIHTYGIFIGNWMVVDPDGKSPYNDQSVLRVEYSVVGGLELELLGFIIL